MALSDDLSLSSYGIVKESTIGLVLRLRGGDRVSGHATVLHSWSGNMNVRLHVSKCNITSFTKPVQHLKFNGLELIRGRVVNIVRTSLDSEWCYGHALDGTKQGLVPCNYVRTNEGSNIKCEISLSINALLYLNIFYLPSEENNQHQKWKFFRHALIRSILSCTCIDTPFSSGGSHSSPGYSLQARTPTKSRN